MNKKTEKTTPVAPGDLVLALVENKPAFFARIEKIDPDIKARWWHVKLLILNLPLKVVTWILDNEQIRGADFTMGGVPVRLEKVVAPAEANGPPDLQPQENDSNRRSPDKSKTARILTFKPKSDTDDESS